MENQNIRETMLGETTREPANPCAVFDIIDVDVTYEKGDLIGNMEIRSAHHGVKVVGVTLVLTPSAISPKIYAMAVTSNSNGMALPLSVMATSNQANLSGVTRVAAQMIIAFYQIGDPKLRTCQKVESFSISG